MTSYYQKYYQENLEKERARGKSWYESQDKKALYQKRKARQIELGQGKYYDRPERCFKLYQRTAKDRDVSFELTFDQFKSYWQLDCFYCGDPITTIGLDRVDNLKGYAITNVVSCCKVCNWMKNKSTHDDFISRCKRISERYEQRVGSDKELS